MWLLACSSAGLHIPIDMSPSLSDTFDPPKAFSLDETGRLMNENTDRPAPDTCPKVQRDQVQSTRVTIFLLIATLSHFINRLQRYNFFLNCANLFFVQKSVEKYIYYVYIVRAHKMQKKVKYPMGILWVCYGYPMVLSLLLPYRRSEGSLCEG